MINLYGRFDGYLSHAMVSRGMAYGLTRNGLDFSVSNTHRHGGYEGLDELRVHAAQGYHGNAATGFYVGGYQHMADPWLQDHAVRAALLIAESEVLPPIWGKARLYDLVVAPSRWVRAAFVKTLQIARERVLVVPHGLDPAYELPPTLPAVHTDGPIHFLHVCGAADVLDRKGTPQLLAAWKGAFGPVGVLPGAAKLLLRTPETPQLYDRLTALGALEAGVVLDAHAPGQGQPPHTMRRYYEGDNPLGKIHVVVQPSRAEAFGIVPLEARACGIPVIATACSGHAEHAEPYDTRVAHQEVSHIAAQFIPNGLAPSVLADDVQDALLRFVRQRALCAKEAFLHARSYYQKWSWPKVTLPLAGWLAHAAREAQPQETIASKAGF